MIPMYLKYNWVWNFDYPEPEEPEYRDIIEFAEKLDIIYKKQIEKIYDNYQSPIFMLSGGVDSSLAVAYVKDKNPVTFSLENWNEDDQPYVDAVVDSLKLKHHIRINTANEITVDDIIEVQKFFDHPHSRLLTFFWYLAAKEMKKLGIDSDIVVTGAGPDHYMFEDVNSYMLALAIKRKEYNLVKAIKYKRQIEKNFKSSTSQPSEIFSDKYEDLFAWNQFPVTFQDEEVERLGKESFQFKLREDNIFHMDSMVCEAKELTYQYYHSLTSIFGYNFNMDLFSNEEAVQVYRKIPIEAKNCLGFSKPIMRRIANAYLPPEISSRDKEDWKPVVGKRDMLIGEPFFYYPILLTNLEDLLEHFIYDKNRKLYNYFDYNELKAHFRELEYNRISSKLWNLINLSCWLEIKT